MATNVMFFKYLPYLIYTGAFLLSVISGLLVYLGLSTKEERIQTRIRFRHSLEKNVQKVADNSKKTKTEEWFKRANYPLGLNGLRYQLIYWGSLFFLTVYYVVLPTVFFGSTSLTALLLIVAVGFLASPSLPFSLFAFIMKRVIEYQQAKKLSEVFMLYDLIINEIEMMTNTRINAYSVLRNIKPYFHVLDKPLTKVLANWNRDPKEALNELSEELHSKEADALIGVIANLDEIDRHTALTQLEGMSSMFARSQIENYRRKKKVTTDLLGIPIKTTHFIIILNFIMVIVFMVMGILNSAKI